MSLITRAAVADHVASGHDWTDVVFEYQQMVNDGRLPDAGLIWRIARIPFREAAKLPGLGHLAVWGEALGPDNWQEARDVADAAVARAAYAAGAAAAAGATAAARAARAYAGVRDEIIEMILAEVERP